MKTGAGRRPDERLRDAFAAHGVPVERVRFIGKTPSRGEYFRLYHQLDLCLDPFPYNGITTTCDALWMGVPILTLAGRTSVSRQGASFLHNVGLDELTADSPEAYVEIAQRLAADLDTLARWRAGLRQRVSRSPVTDAVRFTRHLESAYREMWRRWLAGSPAAATAEAEESQVGGEKRRQPVA
jgi:predicted O-linked N-acetylglucosamine transferase (SPINDLY family)